MWLRLFYDKWIKPRDATDFVVVFFLIAGTAVLIIIAFVLIVAIPAQNRREAECKAKGGIYLYSNGEICVSAQRITLTGDKE